MSKKNINVDIETKYKDRGVKKLKRSLNEVNSSLRATASQSKQYGQTVNTYLDKVLKKINGINGNGSGLGGMTKSFKQLATACKAFMALAVVQKVNQLANACLHAASDMEELENITKQVFGRMTLDVEVWAREVSSAMGRSVYQMKKSASDIGNILRGYGDFFDDSQIKNMSEQLAILATDMGSFLNISDERASQAIIAGLTGEAEALKRLGFNIQDTTIKEYALAQGITKQFEAMSQAEKAQLRYQKLLEVTKHVQGDAVRTIDGYANQVKQMEANFSNLAVTIGNKLKPATTDSIGVINALVGGLNRLLTHKTDTEFIADAVTQQADVLRLVKSYETLEKELKTLKEGTAEYKIKADELKTVQSKLIELSPKFADAFNNPKDKVQALKDAVDDATVSIYKMITAQLKQQAIEEVQAREGATLKRHQRSYNKYEEQLTTRLSKNGINANEIADVISVLTENDYNKAMAIIQEHHKNAYNIIQKEAEAFGGTLENSNDNFTSNFATHSAALVSYFADAVQKSVKDMADATEKAYARIGIAEKGISKRLGLKYDDPRLTKNEEAKPGDTITKAGITGGSPKSTATKTKDKWESLRDRLQDLEKSIDDVKLDKVFNEIKDLNTTVLKKQLGKLEQLAGVLNPAEILSEQVRIYEQSINTLKEIAQGTKDKDKLKVVLDKYKEVNSLLEQAKEQLDEENNLENIQNEIKALLKGTSEAVKGKLTEKANIQTDIELAEISELETSGLITKLEATRRRLTSLDTQIKILEENGAYDELYNQKLQAQSLKIKETLLALDKTMQTEELSTAFRTQLEKLSRFAAESLDVENAKKAYKNCFDTLVESIQGLPKELKDKFKNLKDLNQIDKDIKEMLNDANISNEVKNILNALQKLLGETASQLEKSKEKSTKDKIGQALKDAEEIAKNLGLEELAKGLEDLSQMFEDASNLLDSISSGDFVGIIKSATAIIGKFLGSFGKDDGSAKVRKEVEKEKEKFQEEIIAVNNSLRDSVDKLDRDMIAFNKTLIKGIAANTSNANIYKNQKIADEMSKLYLNSFDTKVKTTIARKTWVDTPWYSLGTNDHWEYNGTETEEKSLRQILGISEITSTEQLRKIYEQNKNRKYNGNFEDRPHEGNFFTTEKHHYKELVGSNFNEAMQMLLVFADNADRMKKYSKNTARYGILESFEGLEVTSAGQLKEQALAQMKRLIEASGQDYNAVASKLEAKLNEIIKEDEVIVSAFDDVRNSIHQGLSAGNEMLDTLSNGLQGYFNKIRNNLAKIKYDMEFRDFESGFNKKFQELSEQLVKIRLDNKKSLKDLDPKYLDFSTLFKQMKEMEKVSNDIREVVVHLREQAAAQGISQDIIDKMLPLDKIADKASQISEMLKNAMSLALDMSSFDQFTMSLGDSIYKHVKEAMLQAFVESAKFKELYQDYINTEEYKQAVEQAKSIREVYDIMNSKLQQFENKLKAEGLAFRETNASNGEHLGGFVNGADTSPTYGSVSGGSGFNITINTTIDNKGYIAVEELTEDITNKVRHNMEQALKREVS